MDRTVEIYKREPLGIAVLRSVEQTFPQPGRSCQIKGSLTLQKGSMANLSNSGFAMQVGNLILLNCTVTPEGEFTAENGMWGD